MDEWDQNMVQRDKRITGSIYKQQVVGNGHSRTRVPVCGGGGVVVRGAIA